MKTYFPLLALLVVSSFATGCNSKRDKPATDENTPAETAANSGTLQPRYWRLAGSVGQYPVIMDLAFRPSLDDTGDGYAFQGYHGSYYYESREDLIDFYGSVDSSGMLVLTEVTFAGDSPAFSGKFDPSSGTYKGNWTSGNGKRVLPFELKEDYSGGAVPFTAQKWDESIKLFPQLEESPFAGYSMIWLSPASGAVDEATSAFLTEEIRKGMIGDSLASIHTSPDEAFNVVSKQFFSSYRDDMSEVAQEEVEDGGTYMYSYEQNTSVEVLYNRGNLLSLGFWDYWYSGGAHGNYATLVQSYDLIAKKLIRPEDVFVPGYEDKISPALERAVRSRFGISTSESIGSVLFDEEIGPTENFGITGKGIIFNYPPYEIAAYAMGEIRLFVPFSEVSDLLRPEFKDRFVPKKQ